MMESFEGAPSNNSEMEERGVEALDDYTPDEKQLRQLESFQEIINSCDEEDIEAVVAGGYGLDGLYGKLTRDHGDIDIIVSDDDVAKMKHLMEDRRFVCDVDEKRGKQVYSRPDLPDFKVEFGPSSVLDNLSDKGKEYFLPEKSNASLGDTSFRAVPLEGVKEVIEFQNVKAKEKSWGPYAPAKRSNQEAIIAELENRSKN